MWWGARAKAEAEGRALLLKALDSFAEMQKAQAVAITKQLEVLETHLQLFKAPPESAGGWVNRDEDEYMAELERKGFPRYGTQEEQYKWLQANIDRDLDQLYELRPARE